MSSRTAPELQVRSRYFRAMGCPGHLVVVGGAPGLEALALARIEALEQRWSRFLPSSDVSRVNAAAGRPVAVAPETTLLVGCALAASRETGGLFDPTVLGALARLGYDRTFLDLQADDARPLGEARPAPGATTVAVRERTGQVTVAPGTGFDPGGIGKGLAADLVAEALLAAGAVGVAVNLGGDVRVAGEPADEEGWVVGVEDPFAQGAELARVRLTGAIVTSSVRERAWRRGGRAVHHVIDPATGEPAASDLAAVTVLAEEAWVAEFLATALLVAGSAAAPALLVPRGAAAIVTTFGGQASFLGCTEGREVWW